MLPLPPGSYLLAKVQMAVLFAVLAFASLLITELLAGELTLSAPQLVAISGVMTLGVLPFCAIGMFIGVYVSGSAAPGIEFHVMPTLTSVAVLAGITVLFGGIAIRRLARKG